MQKYEFMVMLMPDVDPTDTKKIDGILTKMLGAYKKSLKEMTVIGKKTLAYEIRKQTQAVYVLATLESEAVKAGDIEKNVRLMPEVLRYMLTLVKE
jgi:small subunit ribosomal protein S6